jgi:pimeloyl-ACP methyl ester carboxylesterase
MYSQFELQHFVPIPSTSDATHTLHAVTLTTSPTSPWIVFANSLLTDLTMWNYLIPYLLSDNPYNILIHSQRGHGLSTLPASAQATTIPSLASDIAHLLKQLSIPTPVHAVVGVSQGGAAALALGQAYPDLVRSVVACDTAAKTPAGNKEAWAGRVGMVYGDVSADAVLKEGAKGGAVGKGAEYAAKVGMLHLAEATVPRWFSAPSRCANDGSERAERAQWLRKMVISTPVEGFVAGAGALSDYDLLKSENFFYGFGFSFAYTVLPVGEQPGKALFSTPVENVLLVAGSLDGNGKVGSGLKRLSEEWDAVRSTNSKLKPLEYIEIEGAGHLPMVDETERFAEVLCTFLKFL